MYLEGIFILLVVLEVLGILPIVIGIMDEIDLEFFKENVKKYLEEICDIYAYSHRVNQFQYLVKIKERAELEAFYYRKRLKKKVTKVNVTQNIYNPHFELPPESYLIVSQEVSNCLNSYAKKFNFRHKRKGGLFGDRYSKILIENEEEMKSWIEKLNDMEELVIFEEQWRMHEELKLGNGDGECSSLVYYGERVVAVEQRLFGNFTIWNSENLRGSFQCLPPKNVKAQNFLTKYNLFLKLKGFLPPW